jgi:prophage regulatory protein
MDRILRLPSVKDATGLSRSSIYKGMADGTFPPSVPLGARAIGWSQSSIEAFIASRIAKGTTSVAPTFLVTT